jgi:putative peptidoglycan lipid II flippase
MKLSTPRTTLTSIGTVGLLTGVAYLASIVRDTVLAAHYGGSPALDIYFIALSPSQFLGIEIASLLYLAFLPEFSRALALVDNPSISQLLHDRVAFAIKGTIAVAILLMLAALLLAPLLAPGYAQDGALHTVRLTFVCLSLLVPVIGVIGVLRAFLEAQGRFMAWALLPAFRSGLMIAVVILTAAHLSVGWLVVGSLVGAGAALAFAWSRARAQPSYAPARPVGPGNPVSQLPASLAPLIASLAVGQATVMLDNAFASRTGIGGVQALALASNLLVIPQALITGAVAAVYFPVYGAHAAFGKHADAFASLQRSIRLVVWSSIPVILLLCTRAGALATQALYHRGAFDYEMVRLVSQTAAGLSLGLAPYACMVLMRQYVLVAGNPWLVFHTALIFFVAKCWGNIVLTNRVGVPGIALSSTLAATVTCAYLAFRVWRRSQGPAATPPS